VKKVYTAELVHTLPQTGRPARSKSDSCNNMIV